MQKVSIQFMSTNANYDFELIKELSNLLENTTFIFLTLKYKDAEESSNVLNLLTSGYSSALINIMRTIARENPGVKPGVDRFIKKFVEFFVLETKMEVEVKKHK